LSSFFHNDSGATESWRAQAEARAAHAGYETWWLRLAFHTGEINHTGDPHSADSRQRPAGKRPYAPISLVHLKLVIVVLEDGQFVLEVLATTNIHDNLVRHGALLGDVTGNHRPVREDHLREGLS